MGYERADGIRQVERNQMITNLIIKQEEEEACSTSIGSRLALFLSSKKGRMNEKKKNAAATPQKSTGQTEVNKLPGDQL